ncbi:MAG: phosphoribosyl-ATP diphosphatase [Nevskia sp.]|nr:phosphoribosyl-ATP diphosphatase [Nevskia sp.]
MSGPEPGQVLEQLYATLQQRKNADPASSYVAGLYAKGVDAILKKVAEEAGETLLAAKNLPQAGGSATQQADLVHELADLWFHTLVLLAAYDLPLNVLTEELARRMGRSGLEEKASRPK